MSVLNTEYKVHDYAQNDEALTIVNNSTPLSQGQRQPLELSLVPLGNEMNQRQGRSILAKSLQLRLNLILNTPLDHANVRIVVFRYKGNINTTPLIEDIYAQPSFATDWVRAFRQVYSKNSQSFQIIWDKQVSLDKDYKSEIQLDKYIKMSSHIKFRQANNDEGRIWILYMFDNLTADGSIAIRLQSRLRYIDN